ncbi:MAG: hypothetical protein SOT55_02470 [Candidatus Cryptobacteroides sp.]|nr:hypothetical protein [Candidatus Cryptobacteroides sp.]
MTSNGLISLCLATALTLQGVDAVCADTGNGSIDRRAVVSRHDISISSTLPQSPGQVGNGKFAFGLDISGLQSFVPFSTLSDWGWHSFPLPEGVTTEDYRPVYFESYGKNIPYIDFNPETEQASMYLKANPHRVNLGRIGFVFLREDGSEAVEADLKDAHQYTDLWTGEVRSSFSLEGSQVKVTTVCHPEKDQISVRVESGLCREGRLKIAVRFPYADNKSFNKFVGLFGSGDDRHSSRIVSCGRSGASLEHEMDNLKYRLSVRWNTETVLESKGNHVFELAPEDADIWECSFLFSKDSDERPEAFGTTAEKSRIEWERFWMSGAAVDLSESTDPRWKELERRIVLSQYLMRLNESGLFPPQESGLVNNGWYGRFHFEMIWWHAAHYFLWGRSSCCDQMLQVYRQFLPGARERAETEGRRGARWPKCTADINREWPCSAHAYLIWQEPHPIYFAELEYRQSPTRETLDKWSDIVLETADYMADYVFWDGKRYVIGPPVTPVSENTDPFNTLNPGFELCYFRYALKTAVEWAGRLGLPAERSADWRRVLRKLASPPVENGYYITEENMTDMWGSHNYEHPAITGMYGWLPGDGVNKKIFRRTFYKVLDDWKMDKIWGWDFPMLAMAAARLGDPEKAIELLTTTEHKFGFDAHGLADTWPFPYFPANGGLLTAVAMMCEGWDGSSGSAPGFPKDGSWKVKYEGFNRMP